MAKRKYKRGKKQCVTCGSWIPESFDYVAELEKRMKAQRELLATVEEFLKHLSWHEEKAETT